MKKRSLVAMGLAGVMTIGMCVPVLAADTDQDVVESGGTNPTIPETNIEMEVQSQYTVNIPTRLEVDSQGGEKSIKLSASKTVLGEGKSLEITLSTKELSLALEGSSTVYKMEFSGINAATSGEWALYTFANEIETPTEASDVKLTPVSGQKITKSGTYKATVTFNIHEVNTPTV